MCQLSLLDDESTALSGVLPALKAAMRRVAGEEHGEGRKMLIDKINRTARVAGVKLTGGNVRAISKDTLDKWLSPSDVSHPPSINALMAFCIAAQDYAPLRVLLKSVGLGIMTEEDHLYAEIGRKSTEAKKKNAEAAKARRIIKELEERL